VCFLILATAVALLAQVPTGTIAGVVTDESGAVVPNAKITITNKDASLRRDVTTSADGSFSAAALPAGEYEVRTEATGFRVLVRPATVETGATTTVNLTMQIGATKDVVTVEGAVAAVNYDSNTVQGVVTRKQIQDLPLNGRSFLNLAQLEPGVIVTPANPAQFNAQFSVSILGGPASHTAITVDGANIRNPVEGGTGQNFSQEVVQEFQLSSVNFDLSTGLTSYGAINVVTRSGSNELHGSGYFFFRDHNMSAYPSLNRNSLIFPRSRFLPRSRRRRIAASSSASSSTIAPATGTLCSCGIRTMEIPTPVLLERRCPRPTSCRIRTGSINIRWA